MFVAFFDESVHVGSWFRSSFLNVSKGGENSSELAERVADDCTKNCNPSWSKVV